LQVLRRSPAEAAEPLQQQEMKVSDAIRKEKVAF
jgi:hypothetical protein